MDPFARVNSKARKVIESVERQRQTPGPSDPRVGSTGGSFDDDIEYSGKFNHRGATNNVIIQNMNQGATIHAFN